MTHRDQFRAPRNSARHRTIVKKQLGETVASTGVQARLVPVDPRRATEIAALITSCEVLRHECERLFQQIIDLLDREECGLRDHPRSGSRTSS
jgi:hypothetical protein